MARHLIIGITGQDGAYLAADLVADGEYVVGTSRAANPSRPLNLVRLGIADQVPVRQCIPADAATLSAIIEEHAIDRIYLLAGQSSVGLSFADPVGTYAGLVTPALTILELLRTTFPKIRLLYAGSGEVFSAADAMPFTEKSKHSPKSPYAAAKSAAMCLADTYRNAYGVFAANAILFNHESPLRPPAFVIPKIVAAAARMAAGSAERLPLGNVDVRRDWGWAAEYVQAMRRIIEHEKPDDFIVATGCSHSIREAIAVVGQHYGFDLLARCELSPALLRPCDAPEVLADPSKVENVVGWSAKKTFHGVLSELCTAARTSSDSQGHP